MNTVLFAKAKELKEAAGKNLAVLIRGLKIYPINAEPRQLHKIALSKAARLSDAAAICLETIGRHSAS